MVKDLTKPEYKGYVSHNRGREDYLTVNDGAIITATLDTMAGGVALVLEGYPHEVVYAGQPIYKKDGLYHPLGFDAGTKALSAVPQGAKLVGVSIHTARTKDGSVGVLTQGTVDTRASVLDYSAVLSAVKTALPHILFVEK